MECQRPKEAQTASQVICIARDRRDRVTGMVSAADRWTSAPRRTDVALQVERGSRAVRAQRTLVLPSRVMHDDVRLQVRLRHEAVPT